MPSQITDVIFDLDGTLIDSAPSIISCFAATLAEQGIEPALPLTQSLIGPPLRLTLQTISGVNDTLRLETMIEGFKRHYDATGYKATKVFPGVDSMLRDLHADGLSLHIATNKRLKPTRLILEHLGWAGYFTCVYAADSRTPPFGNKSEMLSTLLESERISFTRAVYVGDRSDDKVAADENELDFIAAGWGYPDEDVAMLFESDYRVENTTEMLTLLCEKHKSLS